MLYRPIRKSMTFLRMLPLLALPAANPACCVASLFALYLSALSAEAVTLAHWRYSGFGEFIGAAIGHRANAPCDALDQLSMLATQHEQPSNFSVKGGLALPIHNNW